MEQILKTYLTNTNKPLYRRCMVVLAILLFGLAIVPYSLYLLGIILKTINIKYVYMIIVLVTIIFAGNELLKIM